MKVLRSLIVLALCVALSFQQEDEEDSVREAHLTKETKETQRKKGTLHPNVHLLSQITPGHSDVDFSIVIPKHFEYRSFETTNDYKIQQGTHERVVIGAQNRAEEPIVIKHVTGAITQENQNREITTYIQNYTIDSLVNITLAPQETLSLAYEYFTFTSFQPGKYQLLLAVFYEDSLYDYTDLVFNQTVSVIEPDQTIDFKGFISMILSAILLFFGGFVVFVKISERIYGVPQGKRKTKGPVGFLDKIREFVSA